MYSGETKGWQRLLPYSKLICLFRQIMEGAVTPVSCRVTAGKGCGQTHRVANSLSYTINEPHSQCTDSRGQLVSKSKVITGLQCCTENTHACLSCMPVMHAALVVAGPSSVLSPVRTLATEKPSASRKSACSKRSGRAASCVGQSVSDTAGLSVNRSPRDLENTLPSLQVSQQVQHCTMQNVKP